LRYASLQLGWMKRLKEYITFVKMDSQADRRVHVGENTGPDAYIPPKVEAGGIGSSSENIPWTEAE
jgi:hypothetical protein